MQKKPNRTVRCAYCGREFIEPIPHRCNKNYRKRNLKWINIMEEDKRKRFNVTDFVSNEETPVETWHGEKVLIYNTNRVCHDDRCVCGDIVYAACSLLKSWLKDGCYYGDRSDDKDLFFSVKKKTRTMTNRELAWWLMENQEEHREWKKIFDGKAATVRSGGYVYLEGCEDKECDPEIMIRSNGGEWREPEIEVKEENDKRD